MVNDYTQVIKDQHVARRPQIFAVQGSTVLKSVQKPAAKRPNLPAYRQAGARFVTINQSPDRRPTGRPFVELPDEPQIELHANEEVTQYSVKQSPPPAPKPEPHRVRHSQTEELAKSSLPRFSETFPDFFPKFVLGVLAIVAVAAFAYTALLWQSGEYLIQPATDDTLRGRMLDYVANGAEALAPEQTAEDSSAALPEGIGAAERRLAPSVSFSWQYYTVKKGDVVSKIAAAHAISIDAIIASNKMANVRNLREGDVLRIPNMDGIPYTITANDSYEKVSEKFGVPLDAILDANDVQSGEMIAGEQIFIPGARMPADELKRALGEVFSYPVRGRLSSPFGWRKDPFTGVRSFHKGIDIVADVGVPVKAAMAGKVSMVGFSPILGKYIIVSHDATYQTMYAHLNSSMVTRGSNVAQGEIIGEVGNTGYSTGPHLHFVIYKNGREINPLEQLKL
ncbi:MAG: M23 family metallopeptidase [Spirochaetaceae bacterium]|jgi:murein DD-endopeptidase MepM/ murein hydrolase activator NlpD|nr:M23 family metallopeptidase [Spirochaetaceae bacterium]